MIFTRFAHKAMLKMEPEKAHELALKGLRCFGRLPIGSAKAPVVMPKTLMGISFPNPVGMAAGLDKDARAFRGLQKLGFGFVEVGTVTPKPQPGNPKPRIFRLPEHQAIINRMGFNNSGLDALVSEIDSTPRSGVLGINIGKNKATAEADAATDYELGMDAVYGLADYVTINISSPNTPGLRDLQYGDVLKNLLTRVKARQSVLADKFDRYVPVVVKIAPDMSESEIEHVVSEIRESKLDGIIATNTTIDRSAVDGHEFANQAGGLSGAPLTNRASDVIRKVRSAAGGGFPIIGVGGIMNGQDAADKLAAGADLVQIYSGFIYKGDALIKDCLKAIKKRG